MKTNKWILLIVGGLLLVFHCHGEEAKSRPDEVPGELDFAEAHKKTLGKVKYAAIVCAYKYRRDKGSDVQDDVFIDGTVVKVVKGDLKIGQRITVEKTIERSSIASQFMPGELYIVFFEQVTEEGRVFVDVGDMPQYSNELAKVLGMLMQ